VYAPPDNAQTLPSKVSSNGADAGRYFPEVMSALGLGRVETPGQNGRFDGRDDRTLCPDRRHERLDAHDVHYSGEIVGQYVQCHL